MPAAVADFRDSTNDLFCDGESSPSSRPTSASTGSFFSTLESLPSELQSPMSTPRMPMEHRPPTAGSDHGGAPSSSVLPELIGGIGSFHDDEKGEAAIQLALLIDCATTEEMVTIGHRLRTLGGIERLVALLEHRDAAIHQSALLIIGNLATDTVDPNAEATKTLFKSFGGFPKLLPHLSAANPLTVAYALGAVQNTCMDPEYVGVMQSSGAVQRLQQLMLQGDPNHVAFARNCLMNLRQTVVTAAAARRQAQ